MRIFLAALLFSAFSFGAVAAEKPATKSTKPAAENLPYLGPGADKMPPDKYVEVYRNYIRQTMLLDYPFVQDDLAPCDRALQGIFRRAGMHTYPVPGDAQAVKQKKFTSGALAVEVYELQGVLIQVVRTAANGALDRLFLVNGATVKASRRMGDAARTEILKLEQDKNTGLESVEGVPVGYPHPFLDPEQQGLVVQMLSFNKSKENCLPVEYTDNSWVGGTTLNDTRCTELLADMEMAWANKLSTKDFSVRERTRMENQAVKNAVKRGTKEAVARDLVKKAFQGPIMNDVTLVGAAMRNVAQCNQLGMGTGAPKPKSGESDGAAPSSGASDQSGGKSAK